MMYTFQTSPLKCDKVRAIDDFENIKDDMLPF